MERRSALTHVGRVANFNIPFFLTLNHTFLNLVSSGEAYAYARFSFCPGEFGRGHDGSE